MNYIPKFISCCELVAKPLETATEINTFLSVAKSKLSGLAYHVVTLANWDSFKTTLLENFGETRSIAQIQTELLSCRQTFREDVKSFANRIEKLQFASILHTCVLVNNVHFMAFHYNQLQNYW